MTAISPLELIHKKGLFGNHHRKTENDLIKISEVKNLNIVQVVQYKKSNLEISKINLDGIEFPLTSLKSNSNEKTRILWNGPRNWLVISKNETIHSELKNICPSDSFAITDISHSRAVVEIQGSGSREILKKGCPINCDELKKNNCVGTVFQGINILIDVVEDNPEKFNIFSLRSFGESFYHHITDSALEDGYIGI